jgi:hypothetical protein
MLSRPPNVICQHIGIPTCRNRFANEPGDIVDFTIRSGAIASFESTLSTLVENSGIRVLNPLTLTAVGLFHLVYWNI